MPHVTSKGTFYPLRWAADNVGGIVAILPRTSAQFPMLADGTLIARARNHG
jgi:hypothetical protein